MSTNPANSTPRVESCIAAVMQCYPSPTSAVYYTAVHQELAPLARELEREGVELRARIAELERKLDFATRSADAGCALLDEADTLGSLRAAVGAFIKAKGRYHTEQSYQALVAAFDAASGETPP